MKGERFSFFNIIYFLEPKNSKLFQISLLYKLKSVASRTFSNAIINKWEKTQQLIALNQRNEEDLIKYPN